LWRLFTRCLQWSESAHSSLRLHRTLTDRIVIFESATIYFAGNDCFSTRIF
jgi:hypothetical protein